MHKGYWYESLEEKDSFKDLGIGGVILKRILKK